MSIELPWPTFPEESILGELLSLSREFQAFYQAERPKIVGAIYWARDLSLPEGVSYRTSRYKVDQQNVRVIRLRQIPAQLEDACKIAHELEHFVCDSEGFPLVGAVHKFENVTSALNSMVGDLIVNARLKKYGFDLQSDYETEIAGDIRQLERFSNAPRDQLGRLHWIINYASKVLDWELLDPIGGKSNFQVWFDARYPDIAEQGKKLLAIVGQIGYDTPDKQTRLFRDILRRYKLDLPISYFQSS